MPSIAATPLLTPARRAVAALALGFALGASLPTDAHAQNNCELAGSRVTTITQQGTLGETIYIGAPVIECDDGSSIVADSAVITPPLSVSRLMGRVRFSEVGRVLTADSARYQTQIDRLFAWGRVALADSAGGSDIRGDTLIYLRAGGVRTEDHLTVLGRRVEATLVPAPDTSGDAGADPGEPYLIIARRSIVIQGQNSFEATGEVQLERGDLRAFSDTARYDADDGLLTLSGSARAQGEGYELSGRWLTVMLDGDDVREVLAQRSARLDTEDVDLTAPLIRIFVEQQILQRLAAGTEPLQDDATSDEEVEEDPVPADPRGPRIAQRFRQPEVEPAAELDVSRATAVSEEFLLVADSLDVLMPGEALERALAIGNAHGESFARDSLNSEDTEDFLRHDWLEGDTVIAVFTPAPAAAPILDTAATSGGSQQAPDSSVAAPAPGPVMDSVATAPAQTGGQAENYVLKSLTALGNARSMYRMAPADSVARPASDRRLAVHYVLADAIVINMVDGQVSDMETVGATRGLHLEPALLAGPPTDSTATPADTVGSSTPPLAGAPLAQSTDGSSRAGPAVDSASASTPWRRRAVRR